MLAHWLLLGMLKLTTETDIIYHTDYNVLCPAMILRALQSVRNQEARYMAVRCDSFVYYPP